MEDIEKDIYEYFTNDILGLYALSFVPHKFFLYTSSFKNHDDQYC